MSTSRRAVEQRRRHRWWAAVALGACGLAIVAYAVVGRPPAEPRRDGPLQATRLTAYAGTESAPSLSPEGSQVAFSWNGPTQDNHDIYIKLVGPGEPIQLTHNPARDDSPAWSPDGTEIAFLRWLPHSDTTVDVMVVPALGHAAERRIGTVTIRPLALSSRLSWTPDGHWVAIGVDAPAESRGIWLLSRDGRDRRRLTTSPHGEFFSDFNPVFSSDGRHMAFIRPAGVVASASTSSHSRRRSNRSAVLCRSRLDWQSSSSTSRGQETMRRWCSRPVLRDSHDCSASPCGRIDWPPRAPRWFSPFGGQATSLSLSRGGRLVYVEQYRDSNLERVNVAERASGPIAAVVAESTYDETRAGLFARRQAHRVRIDEDREPGTVGRRTLMARISTR